MFWRATVYNIETETEQKFVIQAPYDGDKVLDLLAKIHPEYETIILETIDRPDWIKMS
jgi:hypothetical protein|tara:strand:+ start:378 stop:551 length:174 start_codon:yes stop_codon:yes gene_type:complete